MLMASMLLLHSTYLKAQRRRRQSIDKRFACSCCCCCCRIVGGRRRQVGELLDWATRCIINQTELSKTSETVLFPIGKQVGEELTIPAKYPLHTPLLSPTHLPWPMTSADGPATVQVATAALTSRKHVDRRLQCTPAKYANGLSVALSASLFHSPTLSLCQCNPLTFSCCAQIKSRLFRMSASWAMRASRPSLDVASINPILFLHVLHTLHPWEQDSNRVYLACVFASYR